MSRFIVLVGLPLLLLLSCASAPKPAETTVYDRVVQTGMAASRTYDLTTQWVLKSFSEPRNILKSADKAAGLIQGQAWLVLDSSSFLRLEIKFELGIEVKDGSTEFRLKAVHLIKTTYDMSGPMPLDRDEPMATSVVLPVSQEGFDMFTREINRQLAAYSAFLAAAR
jgi:hypothetical protein